MSINFIIFMQYSSIHCFIVPSISCCSLICLIVSYYSALLKKKNVFSSLCVCYVLIPGSSFQYMKFQTSINPKLHYIDKGDEIKVCIYVLCSVLSGRWCLDALLYISIKADLSTTFHGIYMTSSQPLACEAQTYFRSSLLFLRQATQPFKS